MTLLGFVGDIMVSRPDPKAVFTHVREILSEPDVMFGNCEAVYTTEPCRAPTAPMMLYAHPDNANALEVFDVMSLANNHIGDCGHDAMLQTADLVRAAGGRPVGVGRTLREARAPGVFETEGNTVAYLAYASVFPRGYEAGEYKPGLAPCRAYNRYVDLVPDGWAPGMLGDVVTVPHETDYANLAEDISVARKKYDVVVASFHWGDYRRPFVLTDHERRTARFAIDHGADVVVGHHHHVLRGIEWYQGRPIFYGLGHFVFDQGPRDSEQQLALAECHGDRGSYEIYPRAGWPRLSMHPDARMTMLAWVQLHGDTAPNAAGFLPCELDADGLVHARDPNSGAGAKIVEYIRRGCVSQRLAVELTTGSAPNTAARDRDLVIGV